MSDEDMITYWVKSLDTLSPMLYPAGCNAVLVIKGVVDDMVWTSKLLLLTPILVPAAAVVIALQ